MKRLCTAALVEEEGSRSAQLLAVLRHELPFVGPSAGRLLDNEPFRGEALVALVDSASSATDEGDLNSAPVSYLVFISMPLSIRIVHIPVHSLNPVIYLSYYVLVCIFIMLQLHFQHSLLIYSYIPFDVTYVLII